MNTFLSCIQSHIKLLKGNKIEKLKKKLEKLFLNYFLAHYSILRFYYPNFNGRQKT